MHATPSLTFSRLMRSRLASLSFSSSLFRCPTSVIPPSPQRFLSSAIALEKGPQEGGTQGGGAPGEENASQKNKGTQLPKETVRKLDEHIVGQQNAKKAIAVALRNRWRVQQMSTQMQKEILPKNILMVGPTGVGKTELARRAARIAGVPFLKVEATKFTEVGYVGRDVDSIIQDLMDLGIKETKERLSTSPFFHKKAETTLIDQIIKTHRNSLPSSRDEIMKMLHNNELDHLVIPSPYRSDDLSSQLDGLMSIAKLASQKGNSPTEKPSNPEKLKVKEARKMFPRLEVENLPKDKLTSTAKSFVENNSIVFIDEIDKICSSGKYGSRGVNTEGVQRDLLPIIEGSIVSTKHGDIDTSKILFICAGAFHICKPSDMLAELQGRLPIKVELDPLTEEDYYRILTQPKYNLIVQHKALMEKEGVQLNFPDETVREIANITHSLNRTVQNIGARRLFTVMERLLEEISFSCGKRVDAKSSNNDSFSLDKSEGGKITIYPELVRNRLGELLKKVDLSRFII